jgi:2-oxoglutarate dehydrogenase E2 component (dihydrolipoamide succinyltransferase)
MAIIDLTMPKMGESIMEATILRWHKKPGDHVDADETVLEIATDKVDSEVPSIVEGEITEILFNENDVVPVGTVIARIKASEEEILNEDEDVPMLVPDEEEGTNQEADTGQQAAEPTEEKNDQQTASSGGARFYSPLVLNIAKDEGIGLAELEQIEGTGLEGRVTKKDILKYVADKKEGKTGPEKAKPETPAPKAEPMEATQSREVAASAGISYGNNVEIIEMSRMRRLIAEHMVQSKHISPHVTSFSEADVTNLVNWRELIKKDF